MTENSDDGKQREGKVLDEISNSTFTRRIGQKLKFCNEKYRSVSALASKAIPTRQPHVGCKFSKNFSLRKAFWQCHAQIFTQNRYINSVRIPLEAVAIHLSRSDYGPILGRNPLN